MDLSVRIGSLALKNPLIAASGCFGYGVEYADIVDLSTLGGVAVKGLFLAEREGHPAPRIVETPAGMLKPTGLRGIASAASSTRNCPNCGRATRPSSSTSAERRSTNTSSSRASSRMPRGSLRSS